MRTYTIKKGAHRTNRMFPRIHFGKTLIANDVIFKPSCEYDLQDVDQKDINKLFGLSYGFHHNNSVRFGWRWDLEKGMVEILAYIYVSGKRIASWEKDLHICYVYPDKKYTMEIKATDEEYFFSITSEGGKSKYKVLDHNGLKSWGYYLWPYFGGNKRAPHTMEIKLKKRI